MEVVESYRPVHVVSLRYPMHRSLVSLAHPVVEPLGPSGEHRRAREHGKTHQQERVEVLPLLLRVINPSVNLISLSRGFTGMSAMVIPQT